MTGRFARLSAALLALVLVAAACGSDDGDGDSAEAPSATAAPATTAPPATEAPPPTTEAAQMSDEQDDSAPAEEEMPGTIVEVAVASESFPTLVAAVQAAGLVDALSSEGPFTVLAPTEEAFAAALDALGMAPADLLGNTALLTAVLTYHVLPLEAPAAAVLSLDGQSVPTVNGAEIAITVDGSTVMVNDATVVATDIQASNGIIHVIDAVLLPPPSE